MLLRIDLCVCFEPVGFPLWDNNSFCCSGGWLSFKWHRAKRSNRMCGCRSMSDVPKLPNNISSRNIEIENFEMVYWMEFEFGADRSLLKTKLQMYKHTNLAEHQVSWSVIVPYLRGRWKIHNSKLNYSCVRCSSRFDQVACELFACWKCAPIAQNFYENFQHKHIHSIHMQFAWPTTNVDWNKLDEVFPWTYQLVPNVCFSFFCFLSLI